MENEQCSTAQLKDNEVAVINMHVQVLMPNSGLETGLAPDEIYPRQSARRQRPLTSPISEERTNEEEKNRERKR